MIEIKQVQNKAVTCYEITVRPGQLHSLDSILKEAVRSGRLDEAERNLAKKISEAIQEVSPYGVKFS